MPANTKPIFIFTPNRGVNGGARINGANTTRDLSSTTNAAILITGGTNGTRIDVIEWTHSSSGLTASVATMGRVFQCSDTSFSNPRLIKELPLAAATPAATVTVGRTDIITFTSPLFLPPGYCLVVTMSVAQSAGNYYDVVCYGGDY